MTGVEVYWYDDDETILYYQAKPDWRWEAFYEVMREIRSLTDHKEEHFYLIADFTHYRSLPAQALIHIRSLSESIPPNLSVVAMIGVSPIIRHLYGSFARIYGKLTIILDMRFVNTLDEALVLLAEVKGC